MGVERGDLQARLNAAQRYAETCGAMYPYPEICLLSDRPSVLAFDDERRLHHESGPALSYTDGWSIHAWHGTRLPREWVEQRDVIDPAEILACEDVEKRSAGLQCIGLARALDRLDHRVLDDSGNPDHGALIEVRLPDLPRPGRFLRAECPRNGTIMEGVPPEIETVLQAQAWRVGMDPSAFKFPERRT